MRGGPAGSIAALVLARAGAQVRLLDRARFPRDKLCGDTLNPGALAILRRLGLELAASGGVPIRGMIVTGEPAVQVEGPYGDQMFGMSLPRRTLDLALLVSAVAGGVGVEESVMVREPIVDGDAVRGVTVAGADGRSVSLRAPVVIAGADHLPVLRQRAAAQAGRDRHRDAGIDPASMEGDPACPREVHLPGLREDQPGSGALPCDRQGLGRPQPAGDDPVREVWAASAAQPPGRTLRQGGRAAQPVDPGRPGGSRLRGAGTDPQAH